MELEKPPFSKTATPPRGDLWFTEYHSPGTGLTIRVRRTLFSDRSPFQEISVVETDDFGRMLLLDGTVQTTERDEFVYHEMLVHVPLCLHKRPRRVLVVGGGDGGCVREALLHPQVEKVTLVEIDGVVVDCCRKFLPTISGKLDDTRVDVRIQDGVKFVREHKRAFDVIIVDSTDPVNMAGPLTRLSFFRSLKEALAPGGIYAAQTQGPIFEAQQMRRIARTVRKVFPAASFFLANTPTYPGGIWSFAVAPKAGRSLADVQPRPLPRGVKARYYSAAVHRAAFVLPPFVEAILR